MFLSSSIWSRLSCKWFLSAWRDFSIPKCSALPARTYNVSSSCQTHSCTYSLAN